MISNPLSESSSDYTPVFKIVRSLVFILADTTGALTCISSRFFKNYSTICLFAAYSLSYFIAYSAVSIYSGRLSRLMTPVWPKSNFSFILIALMSIFVVIRFIREPFILFRLICATSSLWRSHNDSMDLLTKVMQGDFTEGVRGLESSPLHTS